MSTLEQGNHYSISPVRGLSAAELRSRALATSALDTHRTSSISASSICSVSLFAFAMAPIISSQEPPLPACIEVHSEKDPETTGIPPMSSALSEQAAPEDRTCQVLPMHIKIPLCALSKVLVAHMQKAWSSSMREWIHGITYLLAMAGTLECAHPRLLRQLLPSPLLRPAEKSGTRLKAGVL